MSMNEAGKWKPRKTAIVMCRVSSVEECTNYREEEAAESHSMFTLFPTLENEIWTIQEYYRTEWNFKVLKKPEAALMRHQIEWQNGTCKQNVGPLNIHSFFSKIGSSNPIYASKWISHEYTEENLLFQTQILKLMMNIFGKNIMTPKYGCSIHWNDLCWFVRSRLQSNSKA